MWEDNTLPRAPKNELASTSKVARDRFSQKSSVCGFPGSGTTSCPGMASFPDTLKVTNPEPWLKPYPAAVAASTNPGNATLIPVAFLISWSVLTLCTAATDSEAVTIVSINGLRPSVYCVARFITSTS
ncbi:Uncharacterised protein [Mycobacteroides abscessus subsp. abscessus]|nr:Uncharacterised protein [Mycobacteroides abscessus subsp. abscessus]